MMHAQTSSSFRPRGFAAIFSISLIILVGAALAGLGAHFAGEYHRTRSQADEAQLRQLLTTAAAIALAQPNDPPKEIKIALPSDLETKNATLTLEFSGEGADRTAIVQAALGERRTSQTLKLHRENNRWTLVAADLNAGA